MQQPERYTIPLVPNVKYKTYQLHAQLGPGKQPRQAFGDAICLCAQWLRMRLREHDAIPAELSDIPADSELLEPPMLRSFRMENGFILEVRSLWEAGVWALRIHEPEVFFDDYRKRKPVVGRQYETNIGLRINEEVVEFGIYVECSQPVDVGEDCEVFRPQIVKMLCEQPGLVETRNLNAMPIPIRDKSDATTYNAVCREQDRLLPIVLLQPPSPSMPVVDVAYIVNSTPPGKSRNPFLPNKHEEPRDDWWEPAVKALSRSLQGCAYVYHLDKAFLSNPNSDRVEGFDRHMAASILYPGKPSLYYSMDDLLMRREKFFDRLKSEIRQWPKRNALFTFGNVLFVSGVAAMEMEHNIQALRETVSQDEPDPKGQNALQQALSENAQLKLKAEMYYDIFRQQDKRCRELEDELKDAKRSNEDLERKLSACKDQYDLLDRVSKDEKATLQRRIGYPRRKEGYAKWVRENYFDELIVLPDAQKELNSAEVDIELLCDATYVLAKGYTYYRQKRITWDEYEHCRCHAGCQPFEISSCGKETMRLYRSNYEVNYDGGTRLMDMHLKWSRGNDFVLRIYFFFDDKKQKLVIGHLPTHLRTKEAHS